MKNGLKRIVAYVVTSMIIAFAVIASGINTMTIKADNVSQEVLDAKNGVVEVNVNHVDSTGKSYLIQGGSGFLIGSGGAKGSQYVITNYHVANLDANTEAQAKLYFNTEQLNTRIEIVVKGDVTVNAQILKQSQDSDYAILKLDEIIYDRETLKLSKNAQIKQTQNIYALGFPAILTYVQDMNYYTSNDVTITQGTVSKLTTIGNLQYIQHSAKLSNGNSGGPLVDENGYVVGVNTATVGTDYSLSLQIDEIIKILDAFAIPYEEAPQVNNTSQESNNTTTQEVTQSQEASSQAVDKQDSNNNMMLIIIIAVVVVIIIVVVVIVIVSNNKKKQQAEAQRRRELARDIKRERVTSPNQVQNGRVEQLRPEQTHTYNPMEDEEGQTSVLDNGTQETSVLQRNTQSQATLYRVKTGENILIGKQEFLMGKERNKADYCITNNNSISRLHSKIVHRNGVYFIVDLNSTNCTFVNGKQIPPNQEIRLNPNDKILLADEEFIFR